MTSTHKMVCVALVICSPFCTQVFDNLLCPKYAATLLNHRLAGACWAIFENVGKLWLPWDGEDHIAVKRYSSLEDIEFRHTEHEFQEIVTIMTPWIEWKILNCTKPVAIKALASHELCFGFGFRHLNVLRYVNFDSWHLRKTSEMFSLYHLGLQVYISWWENERLDAMSRVPWGEVNNLSLSRSFLIFFFFNFIILAYWMVSYVH